MAKIWLVNFSADEIGTFTYSVVGTTVTENTGEAVYGTITSADLTITIK